MWNKNGLFIAIILLVTNSVLGQHVSIYGFVSDAGTSEKLPGAFIYNLNRKTGVVANDRGYYSLQVQKGDTVHLKISFVGCKVLDTIFVIRVPIEYNVKLFQSTALDEVVVTSSQSENRNTGASSQILTPKDITSVPSLGGEHDVMKVMQMLPGISLCNEGSSQLSVRGGGTDQNLMLLDGVPMYFNSHIGGLVSNFNDDALNSATLYKGGFPSRFGNRLSSVIDIKLKDGNPTTFKGNVTLGTISTKAYIEGPIKGDTCTYLVSFRRFLYDLASKPITKIMSKGMEMGYTFYDFTAKVQLRLSKSSRMFLSFYNGRDKFSVIMNEKDSNAQKTTMENIWGNTLGSLRLYNIINTKLFLNTTAYYSEYKYSNMNEYLLKKDSYHDIFSSGIKDVGINTILDLYATNWLKLQCGASEVVHDFVPASTKAFMNINGINDTLSTKKTINNVLETSFFVESNSTIANIVNIQAGLRTSIHKYSDTTFKFIEPRILVSIKVTSLLKINYSYSQMSQSVHLITDQKTGLTQDYWVPSTRYLPPEKSTQQSFGLLQETRSHKYEFGVEGFIKTYKNLVQMGDQPYWSVGDKWESAIESGGTGRSHGIEFYANKKIGIISGWANYTYSKTMVRFPDVNAGLEYPYKYDRTHSINITASYAINKRVNISASWKYATGLPYTMTTKHYQALTESEYYSSSRTDVYKKTDVFSYGKMNAFRMSDYHKLDVSMTFRKDKKYGYRVWTFSVYNLYNRQNAFAYYLKQDFSNSKSTPKLYQISYFPIIPSLSYSRYF